MKHATKSPLFALFWRDPAGIAYPAGYYVNQERAGLPPKIFAGNKKSLFLDALKFRKAEKSPIAKKYGYMRLLDFVQVWVHEKFPKNEKRPATWLGMILWFSF